MTTNFKGVRINRTKMPLMTTSLSLSRMKDILINNNENNITIGETEAENLIIPNESSEINIIGDDISADYMLSSNDVRIEFKNDDVKNGFDNLNPDLRQLVYSIARDIFNTPINSDMTLYITSTTREGDNESLSDHAINGKPSEKRKTLRGKDANGIEKSYVDMGCAIDMYIKVDGQPRKGAETAYLFNLIANNYTDYIRQLIWETVETRDLPSNYITNVVHLASYGKRGEKTDKTEIFAAARDTTPQFSAEQVGYENLPTKFLIIIKKLIENNKNFVKFLNFTKKDKEPTIDLINKLLK
jgi:hypothetical protein